MGRFIEKEGIVMKLRALTIIFALIILIAVAGCTRTALLISSASNLQNDDATARLIPNFSIESNTNLTDLDVILANGALSNVLNNNGPKLVESWRNPWTGHFGEITPNTNFWVNQTFCLNYIHNYIVNEIEESQQGVACRKEDGQWLDYS